MFWGFDGFFKQGGTSGVSEQVAVIVKQACLSSAYAHELIQTKKISSESILCPSTYTQRPTEAAMPVMYTQGIFVIHCSILPPALRDPILSPLQQ